MGILATLLSAILKPLLDFFRQRHSDDQARKQTERLAREAAALRQELERSKQAQNNIRDREKIDESISRLPDDDVLERLRHYTRSSS